MAERENIGLDADIRSQIPQLDFTQIAGGDRPLTLRELLSHTAGSSQPGFPGYRRGQTLPNSIEVVTDPPHRFLKPVTLSGQKGNFAYSGGGYQIAQLWAENISGQSFAALMQDILFDPLSMTRSTFSQPIDPEVIAPMTIAAANSDRRFRDGVFRPLKDSWFNYPEQAAAGLWSTTEDYARFLGVVTEAANGQTDLPISPETAKLIMTEIDGSYGLGIMVERHENGELDYIWHSGLNTGYRALFRAYPDTNEAIIIFSNAPGGAILNQELIEGFDRTIRD